jgi:NADH dehydrogenase
MFGPEDNFTNLFAGLAQMSPVLPLVGGGYTKFQPVFVGDVAQAIARAVDGEAKPGTVYELGGPEVMSFRDILEYLLKVTGRRRLLVPLPFGLAKMKAGLLQFLPKPPLTPDQVELLKYDNVVSAAAKAEGRTIEALGIVPDTMEAVVPAYLWRFRKTGQFHTQPTGEGASGAGPLL